MILRQRSNMRPSVAMQCDAAWPWWCRLDSSASVGSSPRVTDFLLPDHISCGMLTRFCQKSLQNSNTGRLKGQQTMLKANTDLLLDARTHARKRTHRPDSGNLDRYQNPNTIQTNRGRERGSREFDKFLLCSAAFVVQLNLVCTFVSLTGPSQAGLSPPSVSNLFVFARKSFLLL